MKIELQKSFNTNIFEPLSKLNHRLSTKEKIIVTTGLTLSILAVRRLIASYTAEDTTRSSLGSKQGLSFKTISKKTASGQSSVDTKINSSSEGVFFNDRCIKIFLRAMYKVRNPRYSEIGVIGLCYLALRAMNIDNTRALGIIGGERLMSGAMIAIGMESFYAESCLEELTDEKLSKYTKSLKCIRPKQLANAVRMFERDRDNFMVSLVGDSGAGKSVLLYQIAETLKKNGTPVYRLNLDVLRGSNRFKDKMQGRIAEIGRFCCEKIIEANRDNRVVLILDEMAMLNDPNEKGNSINNYLKLYLEMTLNQFFPFQILGATTTKEMQQFYDTDFAMKRRVREVYLPALTREELEGILS